VSGSAQRTADLAERLPNGSSWDYGKPFAKVFAE
jgi:methenyltetrahydromethanopterin cyclohydrolase